MNKNQSIGMYIILGIMVLALVSSIVTAPVSSTEDISYTTFIQKVENKEIKSVNIEKETLIAVPIKQPETPKVEFSPLYGERKIPRHQYRVILPENSDILTKLENAGVEISAKKADSGSGFGFGSSFFITILLIIGFIALIVKSIQAGGAQAMSFG